ncbi:hypothetical protein QRN89_29410 [Streptomyces chengbuensis]|nr:hypothetical protein [Streptomyces sp. HUAS CB01]WJY53564.1 hypothetical protein QRN89_29410 [Streptomyces sp. HUAS CB01]
MVSLILLFSSPGEAIAAVLRVVVTDTPLQLGQPDRGEGTNRSIG